MTSQDQAHRRVALIVITGGARGIGEAIALRYASDPSGIDVAVLDLPSKEGELSSVVKAMYILADVSKEEDVHQAVERTVEVLGGLDIMVADAGVPQFKSLIDVTVEDWDNVLFVNAKGVMLCYKYATIQMTKQGRGGRIIGACSVAGKQAHQSLQFEVSRKLLRKS